MKQTREQFVRYLINSAELEGVEMEDMYHPMMENDSLLKKYVRDVSSVAYARGRDGYEPIKEFILEGLTSGSVSFGDFDEEAPTERDVSRFCEALDA